MQLLPIVPVAGRLLIGFSAMTFLPIAFSAAGGETRSALAFAITGLISLFIGGALVLSTPLTRQLDITLHGLPLLAVVWFILPLFGGLPFVLDQSLPSLATAYFEATSAMTTTGATAFVTLTGVSRGILIWRAEMQWIGGLATLVAISILLAPIRRMQLPDFGPVNIEHLGRQGQWLPRSFLRTILPLYVGITVVCWAGLSIAGVPTFDSLCLAFAAISTGGLMPRDGALVHYGSSAAVLILTLTMMAGAISLVWLRALLSMKLTLTWSSREPFWVLAGMLIVGFYVATSLHNQPPASDLIRDASVTVEGFAAAVSLMSTTGFLVSSEAHGVLPFIVVLFLAFLGAGRFSTAGGLKFYRLGAMTRQLRAELDHLIYPSSAATKASEDAAERNDLIGSIWTYLVVAGVVVACVALVLALDGLDPPAALLAAVSAVSNVGPAYNLALSGEHEVPMLYAEMSERSHVVLALAMVLGRFEILALLTLFNLTYWRG
ncbi:MAG: hypothetical protein GC150_11325 [Rhizobiales bacterium]|nr:hypothetical protein [Hyphomicrobiales bacterium]